MNEEYATSKELEVAREIHCVHSDNEIDIVAPAQIARGDDGFWVQGWLFVSIESLKTSQFGDL